jgi:hypothetical protein
MPIITPEQKLFGRLDYAEKQSDNKWCEGWITYREGKETSNKLTE